jgi:uncharacterized membrane protein YgdD (TMEM256/DUF423 family)
MKVFITLGALCALIGVALGAFGAHALKNHLTPDLLAVWHTGVQYQLIHALGLILIGILCQLFPNNPQLRGAGWTILSGILLFSGSLYALTLTGIRTLGMITPLGGVAFLAGWILLILAIRREPSEAENGER